jgi:hypothetical protein
MVGPSFAIDICLAFAPDDYITILRQMLRGVGTRENGIVTPPASQRTRQAKNLASHL